MTIFIFYNLGPMRHCTLLKFRNILVYLHKKLIQNLAKVKNDGTVDVDVTGSAPVVSKLLGLDVSDASKYSLSNDEDEQSKAIPKLNIAMIIVEQGEMFNFLLL